MNIGVVGLGRLGTELVKQGCLPISYRLGDNKLLSVVNEYDCIINAAAYTDVDGCEKDATRAIFDNAVHLYKLANCYYGKIVHVSTDFIFDGKNGPYTEQADPNPLGIYGATKLFGEKAIFLRGQNDDLIVRTTVLFDTQKRNFVSTIRSLLCDGTQITLPINLTGNPTYVPHLAQAILYAIKNGHSGIRNIAGRTILSRYHLGLAIADCFELDRRLLNPIRYNGLPIRPLNAGLVMGDEYPMMLELLETLAIYKKELKEMGEIE